MFPRALTALVLTLVVGASVAMAASLGGVTSAPFGAGTAVIGTCDEDGVSLDFVLDTDEAGVTVVSAVVVDGIAAPCAGGDLRIALAGGDELLTNGGPATVPADGATLTVPLDEPVEAERVDAVHVHIQGPP